MSNLKLAITLEAAFAFAMRFAQVPANIALHFGPRGMDPRFWAAAYSSGYVRRLFVEAGARAGRWSAR